MFEAKFLKNQEAHSSLWVIFRKKQTAFFKWCESYCRGRQAADVAGGRWPATSSVHYTTSCNTQSSAPEDG